MPTHDETPAPWRVVEDGAVVVVRLTPRGGRDAIDGPGELADGRKVLLARVRKAPEDGAANAALLKLLAKSVGVPPSSAEIVSGQTARVKVVRLHGDGSRIVAALTERFGASTMPPTSNAPIR